MDEKENFPVLLVDDSQHDVLFIERAWQENGIKNPLLTVANGQECLDYLRSSAQDLPRPGLILLDIQMPIMDGIECLAHIRADEKLKTIPVVMLTNSRREEELIKTYNIGCNSYIQKPMTFSGLVNIVRIIHEFWACSRQPAH